MSSTTPPTKDISPSDAAYLVQCLQHGSSSVVLNTAAIALALSTKPHNVTCRISTFRKKYGLNISCVSTSSVSAGAGADGGGPSTLQTGKTTAVAGGGGRGVKGGRVTKPAAAGGKGKGKGKKGRIGGRTNEGGKTKGKKREEVADLKELSAGSDDEGEEGGENEDQDEEEGEAEGGG